MRNRVLSIRVNTSEFGGLLYVASEQEETVSEVLRGILKDYLDTRGIRVHSRNTPPEKA